MAILGLLFACGIISTGIIMGTSFEKINEYLNDNNKIYQIPDYK